MGQIRSVKTWSLVHHFCCRLLYFDGLVG